MAEIKLFNKWSTENIKVNDPGLRKYIALPNFIIPRTFGRNTEARFGKSKSHIVERLMGKIIATGHKGKKHFRKILGILSRFKNRWLIRFGNTMDQTFVPK